MMRNGVWSERAQGDVKNVRNVMTYGADEEDDGPAMHTRNRSKRSVMQAASEAPAKKRRTTTSAPDRELGVGSQATGDSAAGGRARGKSKKVQSTPKTARKRKPTQK